MLTETNCCGLNLDFKKITFLGILTLSFPLLILGFVLRAVLIVPAHYIPLFKRIHNNLFLLLKVNYRLINSSLPLKARCVISSKIFSISPLLSGLIFKYFNLAFLFSIWVAIILGLSEAAKLIR